MRPILSAAVLLVVVSGCGNDDEQCDPACDPAAEVCQVNLSDEVRSRPLVGESPMYDTLCTAFEEFESCSARG